MTRAVRPVEHRGVIPELTGPQRLTIARQFVGLNQGEMAERLGVTTATVQRAEAGQTKPRRTTYMAWSMATGVDLYWLETGKVPSPNGDGTSVDECAIRDSNPEPADKWVTTGLPQLTALDRYRHAADVKRVRRAGVAA